jgi:hypothetical protein
MNNIDRDITTLNGLDIEEYHKEIAQEHYKKYGCYPEFSIIIKEEEGEDLKGEECTT